MDGLAVLGQSLLPLRGLAVTLEFREEARFSFFHQAAVHAFVRGLVGSPEDFSALLTLDAPESGRSRYRAGDRYHFAVIGLAGAEPLLARLIAALRRLPAGAPVRDAKVPLRDNVRLVGLHDLFSAEPVSAVAELTLYDGAHLAAELALWQGTPFVLLQFLSPARLLRDQEQRAGANGEERYCHDLADLASGVLAARVYDSLADLTRRHGVEAPRRQIAPGIPAPEGHLFWVDNEYRDAAGQGNPMGGLCGRIHIGPGPELAADWLGLLVLGQYIGIGQRRAFGLGRYRLSTPDGSSTVPEVGPAASLLTHAARPDALYDAYCAMRDNLNQRGAAPAPGGEDVPWGEADYPDMPDPEAEERLADRLERLSAHLADASYEPPNLRGIVIREPDGDLRGLAIPPFWDRVCQRAVNDCIAPVCELIQSAASHGYRRGRSRHTASYDIHQAYRDGYRWIYEADIDDFFDSVDWHHLRLRLEALYRDDPVVELILAWMAAPVDYQGFPVRRTLGLPQGAPLSPTMANLMLDDFDSDLEHAGFRLVRYADDFVVLCKTRDQAEAAGLAVRASLAELGLRLNEDKSRAVSFEQGFRFLGFLFMNDLVLDVGGSGSDRAEPATPKPPPPNSWIARIGQRPPQPLGGPSPTPPTPPAPVAGAPLAMGERGDAGLLLMVTGRVALISSRAGRVVVTRDDQPVAEAPWRSLSALLLIGSHHITTPALRAALAQDVPVHFASGGGRYQGAAWSARPGAEGAALWLLQRERMADPAWALASAITLVMARIRHMREVLRQRDPGGFTHERHALDQSLGEAGRVRDSATLLGVEGNATRVYFSALATLVPAAYGFDGRNKRPPTDPFNGLLSLGYSVLHAQVLTLLHVAGLYPWVGFYHVPHGAHAVLASDLMEPFRHVVERAALAAVGRGGIPVEQFRTDPSLGCRLTPPALKQYFGNLWERLERPVGRVGETESHSVLQQIHRQNRRLIEALRSGAPFDPWISR